MTRRPDPEELAAFIDGKLTAAQRDELLAQLDRSPDDLSAFADAVAVERELGDAAGSDSPVGALRRVSLATRWYRPAWIAIAATLVLAIGLPLLRTWSPSALPSAEVAVARLPRLATGGGAIAPPPWPMTRGGMVTRRPEARGVRIGVRIVDLVAMGRVGDSTTAAAHQIADMLAELPAGSVAASAFRSIAPPLNPGRPAESLRDAIRAAEAVAGETPVRTGAWLEAARIAAADTDSAFFEGPEAVAAIRAIQALAEKSIDARLAARRLGETLGPGRRPWAELRIRLNELLRILTS